MIRSRIPETKTSIFAVMTAMAKENGAINLSQGFPDYPVAEELKKLLKYYIDKDFNQYAPMPGTPELRKQIRRVFKRDYQREFNDDTEITVFSGATEAIFVSIQALVSPGDEVIIIDPAYDSYIPAVKLAGGRPVRVPMTSEFTIDWDAVGERITEKTSLLIINTPHNPTGAVLDKSDLKMLENLISANPKLFVLSDEVYHRIVFNQTHQSVINYSELSKRAIAVYSFGKTFHATGWKLGFTIAPEFLTRELRKIHQFVTYSVHTPTQLAIAEYLKKDENTLNLPVFFKAKRDLLRRGLSESKFDPLPCNGTYFQLARYTGETNLSDYDFAKEMIMKHKIASIPISVFYEKSPENRVFRFCFAKDEKTILSGISKLKAII